MTSSNKNNTLKLNKQQRRRIAAQQADKLAEGDASQSATVVCHLGYQLILEQYGALLTADWRKHSGDIACNDRVLIHRSDDSHAVVEAILPRHNALAKWQGRKAKTIAANLDQLLITIAAEPLWQENLIDRHLIAAHYAGIPAAILLNKTDLLDDAATAPLEARLAPYQALDIPVYRASLQENGVPADLAAWLQDKQTILCGQSGVGKSSLIRSLKPDADIWIQAISEATGHGRHTTTNLRRYPLDDATALIDTPGVRGFALEHLDRAQILAACPDIREHASRCRFHDCDHQTAPDCAVLAALERGDIAPARYHNLLQLLANP